MEFLEYNREIQEVLNENNGADIYRLANFTKDKYISNFDYYENLKDINEYFCTGISYQG